MKSSKAFTIVELLIVIVVIGILASITIVAYNGIQNRARSTALLSDAKQASTQLELIKADTGSYPATTTALQKGSGITYDYTTINSNASYCLTATSTNGQSVHTSSASIGQTGIGPCPVGHWSFDGDAKDSSIYQNHGTENGATLTADRNGNSNAAYGFVNGNNIAVANNGSLYTGKQYSVSFWLYTNQAPTGSWRQLFTLGNGAVAHGRNPGVWLHPSSMGIHARQSDSNGSEIGPTSNRNVAVGQWTLVTFTSTGDSGVLTLYLNDLVSGRIAHTSTLSVATPVMMVGNSIAGKIDDVRVFNRALSEVEIRQLYEAK